MTTAEKLVAIADNLPAVYAAGGARCAAKHFVTAIPGNGQAQLQFHVPFAPDVLCVFNSEVGMYGKYGTDKTAVSMAYFDLAGFGLVGGHFELYYRNGTMGINMTTASIHSRVSQAEDGTVTLQNLTDTTFNNLPGIFAEGREYVIAAFQYVEASDRERITEFVRSLTGTGSVTLNRAKVSGAFTDEEWAALAAEQPGWTFSFI